MVTINRVHAFTNNLPVTKLTSIPTTTVVNTPSPVYQMYDMVYSGNGSFLKQYKLFTAQISDIYDK